MAIEIQELNIRSTVSGDGPGSGSVGDPEETEKLREEILADCRRMIVDLLRAERDR